MGPEALAQVLRPFAELFPAGSRPELLVGLEAGDDAAVYRIDDSRALVFTTDFFPPVVDDPADFGSVAAANSLSDVYAMGGEPALALSIAGVPSALSPEVVAEIFRGGGEKAREAGCVVAGGHTLVSPEPMFGLAVIGFADPRKLFLKTGARRGDVLVLSKPLGVGVITTALKRGQAAPAAITAALDSMKKLNRDAARIFAAHGVRGCTDVTGFSLLGHALELATKSGVGLKIHAASVSFLPGALEAAAAGAFPGGTTRNRAAYERSVRFAPEVEEQMRKLLFSPETSGGLLAAVPPDWIRKCMDALSAAGLPAFILGEADGAVEPGVIVVK